MPSERPPHQCVAVAVLTLLATVALTLVLLSALASPAEGAETIQITDSTYLTTDHDSDGLNDSVRVNVTVNNGDEARSKVYVVRSKLLQGAEEVDLKTVSDRLDPNGTQEVSMKLVNDMDGTAGTYTVSITLFEESLEGEVRGEESEEVQLYPLGSYELVLSANRTSASAIENTTVRFSVTVRSNSNNPTGVRVSATNAPGWEMEAPDNLTELSPGGSAGFELNLTVPHNAPPGTKETVDLEVVAMRNLSALDTLRLSVTVELQRYELAIRLLREELVVASGDVVNVTGFLTNRGNNQDNVSLLYEAPAGWTVVFDPGHLLLDRGATVVLVVTVRVPGALSGAGELTINLTARSQGLVETAEARIRVVYNTPDLHVEAGNVTVTPETPRAGENITVQAKVFNLGAVVARDVVVVLQSDDVEVDRRTLGTVLAGSFAVATLTHEPSPGLHMLRVIVDPEGDVPEMTLEDNVVSIPINVQSPDLSVGPGDIVVEPDYPAEDSEVTLTVTVENIKPVAAGPFRVNISVDGDAIATLEVSTGLIGGANTTVQATWTAVVGRHSIVVEVDPDGDVLELDLSNNVATRSLSVNSAPTAAITASKDEVEVGTAVAFDGSGSADADGRVRQYFFDYGDGTDSGWTFNPVVNHTYSEAGEYLVTLFVRDEGSAQSIEAAVVTVEVTPRDDGDDESPGPSAILSMAAIVTAALVLIAARTRPALARRGAGGR